MSMLSKVHVILISVTLTACANLPTAPSVMTLPGTAKSFDQFLADDQSCQQFAYIQIGGTPSKTEKNNTNAPSSTIPKRSNYSSNNLSYAGQQYRYDMSYIQCMYAKGHRVPISGQIMSNKSNVSRNTIRNSTSGFIPPPPKGTPPPPPSD